MSVSSRQDSYVYLPAIAMLNFSNLFLRAWLPSLSYYVRYETCRQQLQTRYIPVITAKYKSSAFLLKTAQK